MLAGLEDGAGHKKTRVLPCSRDVGGTDRLEKPLSLHGTKVFIVALVWSVVIVVAADAIVFLFWRQGLMYPELASNS